MRIKTFTLRKARDERPQVAGSSCCCVNLGSTTVTPTQRRPSLLMLKHKGNAPQGAESTALEDACAEGDSGRLCRACPARGQIGPQAGPSEGQWS